MTNKTLYFDKKGLTPFLDVLICSECEGKTGIDIGDEQCPDCGVKILWIDKKEGL